MPVREALLQLKNEGVLEGTSRGFVLKIYSPQEIANTFEVRFLLEPAAAAQACQHRSEAGLQLMQTAVDRVASAHEANEPLLSLKASWQFRAAWVSMVPNPQLIETMQRLRDRAEQARVAMLHGRRFSPRHAEADTSHPRGVQGGRRCRRRAVDPREPSDLPGRLLRQASGIAGRSMTRRRDGDLAPAAVQFRLMFSALMMGP
jgi:hypothetical protein